MCSVSIVASMAYAQHSELLPWSFTGVVGSSISVWNVSGVAVLSFFCVQETRRRRDKKTPTITIHGGRETPTLTLPEGREKNDERETPTLALPEGREKNDG